MSKKIVAPAGHFYPIPEDVTLEAAAFIEPLAVAWHAVNTSPFKPGDSVLILGGGPIGLGVVQVLKLHELMDNRQNFCLDYGATHILDPRKVFVSQKTRELTDGIGVDVIFDAQPWVRSQLVARKAQ
jgi:threonine dehydrogenase-like Zn-dependent dehydrogenase